MMEWYYILGVVSYGIFLVQFVLSNLGLIDMELDIDFDADPDFSVGDLVSFKGLTHFCMGFSGWLMLNHSDDLVVLVTASIIGILFVIVLAFVYTLCAKLQYEPTIESQEQLVGQAVAIYSHLHDDLYIGYLNNPVYTELRCISTEKLNVGDIREIKSYKNGLYFLT